MSQLTSNFKIKQALLAWLTSICVALPCACGLWNCSFLLIGVGVTCWICSWHLPEPESFRSGRLGDASICWSTLEKNLQKMRSKITNLYEKSKYRNIDYRSHSNGISVADRVYRWAKIWSLFGYENSLKLTKYVLEKQEIFAQNGYARMADAEQKSPSDTEKEDFERYPWGNKAALLRAELSSEIQKIRKS